MSIDMEDMEPTSSKQANISIKQISRKLMITEIQSHLGPTRSWKEQQRDISLYLTQRHHRSAAVPRLLLAQFNEETITVYQAYKPSIAEAAVRNGNFADSEFSFSRMTWIKPSFSWMMHRSGWASKRNQERVLAIRLHRDYFDDLLRQAVLTSLDDSSFESVEEWHRALRESDVVVQWDPDHHILNGARLPYRVLQLGIRRRALEGFKGSGITSVTDITDDVKRLRAQILSRPLTDRNSCADETPLEVRYIARIGVRHSGSELLK